MCGAIILSLVACDSESTTEEKEEVAGETTEEETLGGGDVDETETTEESNSDEDNMGVTWTHVKSIHLVTDMYGDGQKPWYVVIEYDRDLLPDGVAAEDYEVEDYEIEAVYTGAEPELPDESVEGPYVMVELSTDYSTANYGGGESYGENETMRDMDEFSGPVGEDREIEDRSDTDEEERGEKADRSGMGKGGGAGGRGMMSGAAGSSNRFSVTVKQTGEITFADGTTVDAWSDSFTTDPEDNVNLLVDDFSLYTFTLPDDTEMMYALYLPEDYSEEEEYPLVLFMPDATGEGDDEYLALTESLGGVIWTTEEWQSEHETIVLVPQYVSENTEDPALTMELVEYIAGEYGVDRSREYLAGQSSGTIRSIKLMIDYPDEFAGGLLIAGQTDSAYTDRMSDLASQHIWMICSEGDARAYPGMTEITDAVEEAGTEVTVAQWSAKLPIEEQEELAEGQAAEGTTINWTILDKGTVMRDDVQSSDATEHMNTWRVAYDLTAVREWLFEQEK